MEKEHLISVIIPVYNREKLLHKCIESVLAQENVNTEIILIDDGSTDNSPSICDDYSKSYSNVIVIHNTNHGVSYSRNCALDIAKGDYIFFLDSDDYILPDALHSLQKALEDNNADYCIGNFDDLKENGEVVYTNKIPAAFANKCLNEEEAWSIFADTNSFLIICLTFRLFKKEIWENLRFPNVAISEDDFVLPHILSNCSRIFVLDKIVYHHVLSSDSLIRKTPDDRILNSTAAILASINYLISKGYYRVALFRFGDGTRRLMKMKKQLHSSLAQNEIKKQYSGYKKVAKALLSHVNTKEKLRLTLFRFSLPAYSFIRELQTK